MRDSPAREKGGALASASHKFHNAVLVLLSVATGLLVAWVVITGWSFYTTSVADRPHHVDFRDLRPAGIIGHGLGILGTLMVLLLLIYSLRKRARLMRNWGELRIWLRYHIFLGVAGPILITLHTSFKFHGLVSVSYWSMAAVALSGVIGRYLYQQIPRNVLGEALGADIMEARGEEILVQLSTNHGFGENDLTALESFATGRLERRSAPLALLMLPFVNIFLARKLQRFLVGIGKSPVPEAVNLTREWVLQARRLLLFHQIRDLFHYWHVFHKPFAVIMILIMIVHVGVAVMLGYTWEFGPPPE
jgi:hypothetical protein